MSVGHAIIELLERKLMSLTRSKDRKVTNAVSPNGKTPTIANAFGLPAGKAYSCPGATSVCEKVCYAGKLEKVYKGVRNILVSNFEQLQSTDLLGKIALLNEMIDGFRKDCEKRNAEKLFRIHWDGDFYDEEYTRAWQMTIRLNPDVQFWAYTRSDFAVPILIDIENLALYFSTDSANRALGIKLKKQYGVKLAYLANTFAEGKEDFQAIQEKSAVPCPENNKKLPLISEQGSACVRCSQCVFARNDILFSVTKK
jgi:Gene product 88